MNILKRSNKYFALWGRRRPHLVAAVSAASILSAADLTCQKLEQLGNSMRTTFVWDQRRTLSLTCFGFLYYGGPCKYLYLCYDRWFPAALGASRAALKKTLVDVVGSPVSLLEPAALHCTAPCWLTFPPARPPSTLKVPAHTISPHSMLLLYHGRRQGPAARRVSGAAALAVA